jgi:hypothetical protein
MNSTEHHCRLPEEDLGTKYVEPFTLSKHDVTRPADKATRTSVQLSPINVVLYSSIGQVTSYLTNLNGTLFSAVTLFKCCERRCSHYDVHHIIPYVTRPSPNSTRHCLCCTGSPRPELPEMSFLYPKMNYINCKYSNFHGWKCSFWLLILTLSSVVGG